MSEQVGVIVVGVDGSPGSESALDFALAEGVNRGLAVEVVTAWMLDPAFRPLGHQTDVEGGRAVHQKRQDRLVAQALGRLEVRPKVSQLVVHDYAGRVLVARAEGGAMVVVGAGTQSSHSRKTLGSVAEYCIRHSSVPVVVVPEPDRVRRRILRDLELPVTARVG
jgi:nucleotide-binding universal stress UspA family protein